MLIKRRSGPQINRLYGKRDQKPPFLGAILLFSYKSTKTLRKPRNQWTITEAEYRKRYEAEVDDLIFTA